MSVEIGQVYKMRVVEAGEDDWRELKVVGEVPTKAGEPRAFIVQQPGIELESRAIFESLLLENCDLDR